MKPTFEVKTIPELLVDTYGNQSELARRLGINRGTLRKYIKDAKAEKHAVVNGVFMSATFESIDNVYENVPTLASQQQLLKQKMTQRSWPGDKQSGFFKRLICTVCLLPFMGDELRNVCRNCVTTEHTATLRKKLKDNRRKLRAIHL